jgi:CHAT domain-containing protein
MVPRDAFGSSGHRSIYRCAIRAFAAMTSVVLAGAAFGLSGFMNPWAITPVHAQQVDADARNVAEEYLELIKLHQSDKDEEFIARAPGHLVKIEARYGVNNPGFTQILDLLARTLNKLSRHLESELYWNRLLAIYQAKLGPDDVQVGYILGSLASVYRFDGRYEEAERLAKRRLAISEKAGKDMDGAANDLGRMYQEMGRFAEAEILLKRAVARAEVERTPDLVKAIYLHNLANLYMAVGRDEEAEALLKRTERMIVTARKVENEARGYREWLLGANLEYLAITYAARGRNAEAESLLKRAISLRESAPSFTDTPRAQLYAPLARIYAAQGRHAEAEPLLKQVLAIREKKMGLDNRWVAEDLDSLATVYSQLGRYSEAQSLFQITLESLERSIGMKHPDAAAVLSHFAALKLATGNVVEALDLSRRSVLVAQSALNAEFRSGERIDVKTLSGEFTTNLRILRQAGDRKIIGPEAGAEAFEISQWASQSAAATALGQLSVRLASGTDALAQIVRVQQDAAGERRVLDRSLVALLSALPAQRTAGREQELRKRIADLDRRVDELNAKISAEFPDYAELSRTKPLALAQTQQLLGADEALVFLLPGESDSQVFAVTRDGFDWKTIALGAKDLSDKVAAFRRGLEVGAINRMYDKVDKARADKLFDLSMAHEFYGTLLGPVEALIKDKPQLIVVPSGALTALPFHLLVTAKPETAVPEQLAGYRDAAWLIKRQAVTVLPSVASLETLRGLPRKDRGSKPMIGFGDPVFDPKEPKVAQRAINRTVANTRGYSAFWQGSGIDRVQLSRLDRLPETADELKTVAQQLGAPLSDIHLRADASETTVKRLPLSDYRVVYFATHGLVAGDVEGLAEPSLALTLPAKPTAEDDGLLTASEVAQLKLNADWVVLSACNTIAGDKPGAEALSGLARAFFYAGTRALLVSHWAVDSNVATRLTTSTFELLRNEPKLGRAEALQRSMLAEMNDASDPRRAYPALWAPFVVVGEGAAR